jgi:hypothetical protein
MPDPSNLLRIIAGESVFGMDVDSRIRQASNCMSARLMIELFNRCDDSKPEWQAEFAESLSEFTLGDPSALIGFDDGRWQGKEVDDESVLPPVPEPNCTYYLKLTFRNEDAAYYQFSLFPAMDEPFLAGGARKRESQFQHVRVDLAHPDDLQLFIEGLRSNPHLISVEESTGEVFSKAPSHAV